MVKGLQDDHSDRHVNAWIKHFLRYRSLQFQIFNSHSMGLIQQQWKTLIVSLTDAVLTISMNRPKANAMSPDLLDELMQAFHHASNDNHVRGVLLRSTLK